MIKDPLVFIEHIWESIELIEGYLKNKNADDFLESTQLQDAVIRRLEIMGEAVKNIPEDYTRKYPGLPWKELARTRDKLAHGYFGVDLELVWEITQNDLKELKKQIMTLRKTSL